MELPSDSDSMVELGIQFRQKRLESGFSVRDVAKIGEKISGIGFHPTTEDVIRVERGAVSTMSARTYVAILSAIPHYRKRLFGRAAKSSAKPKPAKRKAPRSS